jgi:hypothetical protein
MLNGCWVFHDIQTPRREPIHKPINKHDYYINKRDEDR